MERIDAHQHFWKFDRVRDSWITEEMLVLRNDFLPENLESILKQNGFDGCITVQSDQSETENAFQLANAEKYTFIKGVVGWIDLQADNVEERLAYYQQFKKLKGFRHILQGEPQRDFMLNAAFQRGVGLLNKYEFTYDILIFPDQLQYTKEFVAAFPEQKFVIDHLAKPYIKNKLICEWKEHMQQLAQYPNLYCKISGLVTEGDWKHWTKEDFTPYIDVVVEVFGPNRIMVGSDWPVCLLAADYKEVITILKDYFSPFTVEEQQSIFGQNAAKFYSV